MKLEEIVNLIDSPERIQIITEDKEVIYSGYKGLLDTEINLQAEVVKVGFFVKIFRKEKREEIIANTEGRVPVPDGISEIEYSDLEECLYLKITIKNG